MANKPILFYGIEAIRDAGITDIGIIVGDTADEIMEACRRRIRSSTRRSRTYRQDAPLGLAHAVKISQPISSGDDPFVMYLGDNLISGRHHRLRGGVREGTVRTAQILLARVKNPSDFGVAELDGDTRDRDSRRSPKKPKSDYALVGRVHVRPPAIFDATDRNPSPVWRGELEITDAIQYLIENDMTVNSHIVEGWWKDTGKLEDMLDANRMILMGMASPERVQSRLHKDSEIHGDVYLADDVVIERSILRGPCIVGAGAKIVDAYVGPLHQRGRRYPHREE